MYQLFKIYLYKWDFLYSFNEKGIKAKDLPKEILRNPCLFMMVQDKTLTFQKGKYYLKK